MIVDLNGRTALVTGGSRGIGAAIARALTDAGAVVTVLGRHAAALQAVVAEGAAAGLCVDQLAPRDVDQVETVEQRGFQQAGIGAEVDADFEFEVFGIIKCVQNRFIALSDHFALNFEGWGEFISFNRKVIF